MSELDTAETMLASYFVWFSLALGSWLLVVSFLASRINIWRQVLLAGVLFILVSGAVVGVDMHFRTYMVDSAGG